MTMLGTHSEKYLPQHLYFHIEGLWISSILFLLKIWRLNAQGFHLAVRHPSFRELLDFILWNLQINLTRALRREAFQLHVIGITQLQTTMARLTSCILHRTVTLQIQALKRSQISILVVNRPLKPLGRYLTPGESNRTLNHSYCVVPHEYFISWGIYGKTSHTHFFQFSPFRVPFTLTMLHSFP